MSVAVVTGASSGLGRVISRALLGAGWQVALACLREELLAGTAEGAPDGAALAVPADVTLGGFRGRPCSTPVQDRWGRLDLLVNNAGLFGPAAQADEIDLARLAARGRHQPDRRLPVRPARGADDEGPGPAGRPHHQHRLDLRAHAAAEQIAYTATKHAVTGLTKSLSLDGRPYGIAAARSTSATPRPSSPTVSPRACSRPTAPDGRTGLRLPARRQRRALHGLAAAGRQRPVPHHHRDHNALYRAGLNPLSLIVLWRRIDVYRHGGPFRQCCFRAVRFPPETRMTAQYDRTGRSMAWWRRRLPRKLSTLMAGSAWPVPTR